MGINSILNFFKIPDDDYEEEYEEEYEQEPVRTKTTRVAQNDVEPEEPAKPRSGFLGSKPKVVPMSGRSVVDLTIIKPRSYDADSRSIGDALLSGKPVVVNMEGFDPDEAQRIIDFSCGCIYSIRGKCHQISKYIFVFAPESVDISGDSLTMDGNEAKIPTINREF